MIQASLDVAQGQGRDRSRIRMTMRSRRSRRRTFAVGAMAVAAAVTMASPATAAVPTGPASLVPATGTPHFPLGTTPTYQIRQLVECGSTMYAVGTFSQIISGGTTYTRNGAFSFSATAPYTLTSWDPEVNGTVNSIAFADGDCGHAYLGGSFTTVGGVAAKNIADVDTTTGALVPGFNGNAGGAVNTIVYWGGHLIVGGKFTSVAGGSANPYLASLNPATGKNDGWMTLPISGIYSYNDLAGHHSATNVTQVYNMQISHGGTRMLIEGVFTSVGGKARRQIAMLDLSSTGATVDLWHSTDFDVNCAVAQPFYLQAAAWSADDSVVFTASTGARPATGSGYYAAKPRTGPCDAASAYPSVSTAVAHLWINYTGCDSLYATVADGSTAYFGGHERWASNPNGCDTKGSGAVDAPGMVGLNPLTGAVKYNPTRDRGLGADDMIVTAEGLWVASDNYKGTDKCGGVSGLSGICLLPYS
jgi:hypothetical protein